MGVIVYSSSNCSQDVTTTPIPIPCVYDSGNGYSTKTTYSPYYYLVCTSGENICEYTTYNYTTRCYVYDGEGCTGNLVQSYKGDSFPQAGGIFRKCIE